MNEVKVDDLESATLLTPESPIRTCADQNTTAVVCNVCKRQVDRGLAPGTPKEHAQQVTSPGMVCEVSGTCFHDKCYWEYYGCTMCVATLC